MKAICGLCASGVILWACAGCVIPDYFRLDYFQGGSADREHTLAASLESVSFATQTGLRSLGLKVEATPQGEDVRLTARNGSGEQLVVVLSRVRTETGDQTRVRIEAGTGEYDRVLFQILSKFEHVERR